MDLRGTPRVTQARAAAAKAKDSAGLAVAPSPHHAVRIRCEFLAPLIFARVATLTALVGMTTCRSRSSSVQLVVGLKTVKIARLLPHLRVSALTSMASWKSATRRRTNGCHA